MTETTDHVRLRALVDGISVHCSACGAQKPLGMQPTARHVQWEVVGFSGLHHDCASAAAPGARPEPRPQRQAPEGGPDAPTALAADSRSVDLKERAKREKQARATFNGKLVDLFAVHPADLED